MVIADSDPSERAHRVSPTARFSADLAVSGPARSGSPRYGVAEKSSENLEGRKRGAYVRTSSSQTRSLERGSPSPSVGAGGVPSHPGRRHSVEAVRGVPVGGAPGSSSWPALGARTLRGQGQSAPRRKTDAAPPPRGPYLHGHFGSFLHRFWR